MREILFIGKRLCDGEWVEGAYLYSINEAGEEHRIVTSYLKGDYDDPNVLEPVIAWEVEKETVSQFTGFYDKNGTRIFENDILKTRYDEEHPEDSTKWKIIFVDGEWEMSGIEFYREKFEKLEQFDCDHGEVVGNIFDNEWEEP